MGGLIFLWFGKIYILLEYDTWYNEHMTIMKKNIYSFWKSIKLLFIVFCMLAFTIPCIACSKILKVVEFTSINDLNINNKSMEYLNEKYLELLKKKEIDMELYIDYNSLTEEEYYNLLNRERFNIKDICFDKEGNLWCYSQPGDGCKKINIYDKNGIEYEYNHFYTTGGGEEDNWYTKSMNNREIEYKDEEIIDIFNKFNNLEVDTGRALRLMLKNKKTIKEYDEKQFEYNPNVIFFGKYYQNNISVPIPTEPIEWLVLYNDNHKALLVSRYILEWKQINSKNISNWTNSELNTFLQNDFFNNAFSNKEKSAIIENNNNEKISLMTKKDVENYFENMQELKAGEASFYVLTEIHSGTSFVLNKKLTFDYWLKPYDDIKDICEYVDLNGKVNFSNVEDFKGIRPTMWVSLE